MGGREGAHHGVCGEEHPALIVDAHGPKHRLLLVAELDDVAQGGVPELPDVKLSVVPQRQQSVLVLGNEDQPLQILGRELIVVLVLRRIEPALHDSIELPQNDLAVVAAGRENDGRGGDGAKAHARDVVRVALQPPQHLGLVVRGVVLPYANLLGASKDGNQKMESVSQSISQSMASHQAVVVVVMGRMPCDERGPWSSVRESSDLMFAEEDLTHLAVPSASRHVLVASLLNVSNAGDLVFAKSVEDFQALAVVEVPHLEGSVLPARQEPAAAVVEGPRRKSAIPVYLREAEAKKKNDCEQ